MSRFGMEIAVNGAHMFERMKKEIKEERHSAAPVHERAGAAEKIFSLFAIFGLTFPFGFVIMFCS